MTKEYCYKWSGISKSGKKISGTLIAKDNIHVSIHLKRQGISPVKIQKKIYLLSDKITIHDIAIFYRQLSTLIRAGIPLVQAMLTIETTQRKSSLRSLLIIIKKELEAGKNLSQLFYRYPKHFDAFTCHLIRLGEHTGTLNKSLMQAAAYQEKKIALQKQLVQALLYPAIISLVAILVTFIMLVFIVPRFAELFQHSSSPLPFFTRMVIHFSNCLRNHYLVLCFPLILILFAYNRRHSPSLQQTTQYILLKTPLIRALISKIILARMNRNLAIACTSGMTLIDALKLLSSLTNNYFYSLAIHQLQMEIGKGLQLHSAMQANPLFPTLMVQMIKVGEETGKLDDMFENIAILYEQEVDQMIYYLKQLLEPLIMIILGVLIGGLVVAMYLPIFKLGTVI